MRRVVHELRSFAGRGACTDAERRAALWLHDDLRSRGHEAWVETRWVRPQAAPVLAIGCLLALGGGLLATAAPVPGLVAAALGTLSLAVERAGLLGPIRALFPRRATQHVLTAVPDRGIPLVIAAAYDAPRRGLVLNDRWRALLRPRGALVACAGLVTATAAARVAGVDATWLGAAQLLPTVVLLVAVPAALDIALSGFSPGANDNASGAAVALALHDELARRPPRALAPALLLAGAAHAVPRTIARHLRAERLRRAVLLELGPCGAGQPAWAARHPQARAAAARAADALGARTGARRPEAAGVRVVCLDERGLTPRAHQEDDTDADRRAMEAALDFALAVVDALDAELQSGSTPSAVRSSTGSENEQEP
jgi:hypothetical protein